MPDDFKTVFFFFHDLPEKPFIKTGPKDGYMSSQKHKVCLKKGNYENILDFQLSVKGRCCFKHDV